MLRPHDPFIHALAGIEPEGLEAHCGEQSRTAGSIGLSALHRLPSGVRFARSDLVADHSGVVGGPRRGSTDLALTGAVFARARLNRSFKRGTFTFAE